MAESIYKVWESVMTQGIDPAIKSLDSEHKNYVTRKTHADLYTYTIVSKLYVNSKVYNLCCDNAKEEENVKYIYEKTCTCYCKERIIPGLASKSINPIDYLKEFLIRWRRYDTLITWLDKLCDYINRYYIKKKKLDSLKEACRKIFIKEVFRNHMKKIIEHIITLFHYDRDNQKIDHSLIREVVDLFKDYDSNCPNDSYHSSLEPKVVADTSEYYQGISITMINELNPIEYIEKCEILVNKEIERLKECIPSSLKVIMDAVYQQLITEHNEQLVNNEKYGLYYLLENKKIVELNRITKLYNEIPNGLEHIGNVLLKFLNDCCERYINERRIRIEKYKKDKPQDDVFIQQLLDLYNSVFQMIEKEYSDSPFIHSAVNKSFSTYVNKQVGKYYTAELLSSYCDHFINEAVKGHFNIDETENKLTTIVELFCYVEDKDIFSTIYRTHLSRRLLEEKATSYEFEKHMIDCFRLKCGPQLTCKLEGMLNDLTSNIEEYNKYHEVVKEMISKSNNKNNKNNIKIIDFYIKILTQAYWPSPNKDFNPIIPDNMMQYITAFNSYYKQIYPRRVLHYIHNESIVLIEGKMLDNREYTIQVSLPQAILLLQFNNKNEISYESAKEMFQCDDGMCKRIVSPLLFSKYKILRKYKEGKKNEDESTTTTTTGADDGEENKKVVQPGDIIRLNEKFASASRRVVIPMPVVDNTVYKEKTIENRSLAIEAAIVRIMKSRRQLNHSKLISMVLEQLQMFKPTVEAVKSRIENLIDREYIERDEKDPNTYHYLA